MKNKKHFKKSGILKLAAIGEGNLGVRAIARKVGCSPATVSSVLKDAKIKLPKPKSVRRLSMQKLHQGMALIFLGLNRDQIERLLGVKSATLKDYLLELMVEVPNSMQPEQQRFIFNFEKWKQWEGTLGHKYGIAELVRYIPSQIGELPAEMETEFGKNCGHDGLVLFDPNTAGKFQHIELNEDQLFFYLKNQLKEPPQFIAEKMHLILDRKVIVEDGFIVTRGHKNQIVKIPTSRFC